MMPKDDIIIIYNLFSALVIYHKMFYMKKLRRDILLEPRFLGPRLKDLVKQRLIDELEGQCLGKLGYIVSIVETRDEDITAGLIDIDTGAVNICVWYSAILLRPFKNEVLDTVVFSASDEVNFVNYERRQWYFHKLLIWNDVLE